MAANIDCAKLVTSKDQINILVVQCLCPGCSPGFRRLSMEELGLIETLSFRIGKLTPAVEVTDNLTVRIVNQF